MAEGRKFLTAALRNENPIVEDAVRSAALNARGALANLQRDSAAALEDHRAALAIRQAQHDQRGAATSLHNLAMVHADRTEYAAAVVAFQSAAALYRAVGDAARADHNEHSADEIATHHLGAPESNSSARIRALEAAVQRGDRISEGDCCMAIAMHASRSADFARANQFYRRALRIRLEDQYPLGIADALEGIAAAFGGQGRSADIPLLYAAADSLRTLIGCPIMSANRAPYEQNMRQARETLGEAAFAAAWSAGAALPYSNAVAHALDESLDAMAG
jgi:tetratricopeptide (TPR) repeat protein